MHLVLALEVVLHTSFPMELLKQYVMHVSNMSCLISNHPKVNEDMIIASVQAIDEDIHYLYDEICSKLPITFYMVRIK